MACCELRVAEWLACSVLDVTTPGRVSDVGEKDGAMGRCPVLFVGGVVEVVDDAVAIVIDQDTRFQSEGSRGTDRSGEEEGEKEMMKWGVME